MADKKKNKKAAEITWYVISSLFMAWGLAFIIIGVIGYALPVVPSKNWVILSEDAWLTNWSHMGYLYWGLIILAFGLIIFVIDLLYFAKGADRDYDKAQRRQQRVDSMSLDDVKPAVETVEKKEDVVSK